MLIISKNKKIKYKAKTKTRVIVSDLNNT